MNDLKNIDLKERWKQRRRFEPSLNPPFPKKEMLVELAAACNHKCIFCAHQKMQRKYCEIDENLLERVMREAHDLGTREIGFYSTGEPFLCKKLAQYIKTAKDIGFDYVYLTTNGILATPEKLTEVVEAGVDSIKFSINAGSRETYKLVHGFDEFDKATEHLKFLYDLRCRTEKAFKIYISFVVTKFTQYETELFSKEYSKYCDQIMFYPVLNLGGLMSEIYTHIAPSGYVREIMRPCHLLFTAIGITAEGYLTACGCSDFQNYLVVGDLNKQSLKDAWYSDKFNELRRQYIDKELTGLQCQNCVYGTEEHFKPLDLKYASLIAMDDIYSDRFINKRLLENGVEQ